jgi:hypothetical protein
MDYDSLISGEHNEDSLEQVFKEKPHFWSVEHDVQFWLSQRIMDELDEEEIKAEIVFPGGKSSYRVQYKSDELDEALADKADGEEVKRVVNEVTLKENDGDTNRDKFDIGVLKDQEVKIFFENGTKKYREEDFEALFELKFIKNDHYYKLFAGDVRENSMTDLVNNFEDRKLNLDEIKTIVADLSKKSDDYGFLKDIENLNDSSVEEAHFILLSNYDILYERKNQNHLERNKEKVYRKIGLEVFEILRDKSRSTKSHYLQPYP